MPYQKEAVRGFPSFSLLEQFSPHEAVEREARSRFPLLLLDDQFFPCFMDWASGRGDSTDELILLLSEYDSFRFSSSLSSSFSSSSASSSVAINLMKVGVTRLEKLLESMSSFNELNESKKFLDTLKRCEEGDCLLALYDIALQLIWEEFLRRGQAVHKSTVWNSFKKNIRDEISVDFYSILSDEQHCVYFESFLSNWKGDVLCLKCWQNLRHVIATLQVLKIPDQKARSRELSSSQKKTNFGDGTQAMGIGTSNLTFTRPYDALELMLECVYKYHEHIIRGNCNGISKSSQLKLVDAMEKCKCIKGQIKALDHQYALKLCNAIEDLFIIMERESFYYLENSCFQRFIGTCGTSADLSPITIQREEILPSNEYIALLSSIRLKSSFKVKEYLRKLSFLQEVQSGKSFSWVDTGNMVFSSYKHMIKKYAISRDEKIERRSSKDTCLLCCHEAIDLQGALSSSTVELCPSCCQSTAHSFVAIEFHISSTPVTTPEVTEAPKPNYKYRPPSGQVSKTKKKTEMIKQEKQRNKMTADLAIWANSALKQNFNDKKEEKTVLEMKLFEEKRFEKEYSAKRGKKVRFDLGVAGSEAPPVGSSQPVADSPEMIRDQVLEFCLEEALCLSGNGSTLSVESYLTEILRSFKDAGSTSWRSLVSNRKELIQIFMSLRKSYAKEVALENTETIFITFCKEFIDSTHCRLSIVLTPFPLFLAMEAVIEALSVHHSKRLLSTSNAKQSHRIETGESVHLELNPTFSMAFINNWLLSSQKRELLCRNIASCSHLSPCHDFSLMETMLCVSIKTVILILLELMQSSEKKILHVVLILLRFSFPFNIAEHYRVWMPPSDSPALSSHTSIACDKSPFLLGCSTRLAERMIRTKTKHLFNTNSVSSFVDIDCDLVRIQNAGEYKSINTIPNMRAVPKHALAFAVKEFRQLCYDYITDKKHFVETELVCKYNLELHKILDSVIRASFLVYLPASLRMYPGKHVAACDVARFMKLSLRSPHDNYDIRSEESEALRRMFLEEVVSSASFSSLISKYGYSLHLLN